MSRSVLGGVILVIGLGMLGLFTFGLRLPGGLQFGVNFLFGVIPTVVGAALLWSGWRSSSKRQDPETLRLNAVQDQIIWRAMALGGRITRAEAAQHTRMPAGEIEQALMLLISKGRATVEPGEKGEVVYRVDTSLSAGGGS
jgi:hypothetical protein